jgi:hypothetical protein
MMRTACCISLLFVVLAFDASAKTRTYAGDAVVRSIDATRVAVFLDSNGDTLVDNGFLLTTDIPMYGKFSERLSKVTLVFTDGYLRVTGEEKVYDLQVAGFPEPPAVPGDRKQLTLIGSSLTHSVGNSGCDLDKASGDEAGVCFGYGQS